MKESKNKFEKCLDIKELSVKLKSIKKDQNSWSAALKRSKKEQKEFDEIHEKKVIKLGIETW